MLGRPEIFGPANKFSDQRILSNKSYGQFIIQSFLLSPYNSELCTVVTLKAEQNWMGWMKNNFIGSNLFQSCSIKCFCSQLFAHLYWTQLGIGISSCNLFHWFRERLKKVGTPLWGEEGNSSKRSQILWRVVLLKFTFYLMCMKIWMVMLTQTPSSA